MTLIKQLLREELNERFLSENFFEKMDTPLEDVVECVKNLMFNLRHAIGESYKLKFFKNRLTSSLTEFKSSGKINKKVLKAISELDEEFDSELIKILGINKLFLKLYNGGNIDKVIDTYLDELDCVVDDVYDKFKEKIKADKAYDSVNKASDKLDRITYKKFIKEKYFLQIELLKVQEWAVANDKKILILFEGRDAAGKGSNIETFSEFLNPKNFRIETFGIPTEDEKKNWFKRYDKVLPKKGEMVFFDRSWYNRAVVEPAMEYCTEKQYKEFMDTVGEYEEKLMKDGTILIKIWLNLTKGNQKHRFELRKRDPLRYWKFSENDSKMLNKWDKLTPYIDKMLDKTNFIKSPWEVIQSDDKLKGILGSLRRVLDIVSYDGKDIEVLSSKKGDNVVFLDLHGVVITDWTKMEDGKLDCNKGWNKEAVKNLNKITDEGNAKIVVISACKNEVKFDELKDWLKTAGVTGEVIGKTIDIDKHLRIEQVNNWLANHKVKSFLILDDKPYDYSKNEQIEASWIQPKHHVGLTTKDVQTALEILKPQE
jgi:polyphosphate kinase 2